MSRYHPLVPNLSSFSAAAAAAVGALAVASAGCSSTTVDSDQEQATESVSTTPSGSSGSERPSSPRPAEKKSKSRNAPSAPAAQINADLREAGLNVMDLLALYSKIKETGYALDPGEQASWERTQDLASLFVLNCKAFAAGNFTYEDQIANDVSVGVPRRKAQRVWYYVQDQFCPAVAY